MNNTLYLCVGKSASGKTSIANILERKYGLRQVNSYTTREPRYDGEVGHIFIDDSTFDELCELVAYTEYNDYRYGTTAEQLDQCQIFVVDVPGIKTVLERYKTNRPIAIIYFDTTVCTRINRMLGRGDSESAVIGRLLTDEKDDWYSQLSSIVWLHAKLENKVIDLYQINANSNLTDVLEQVLYYINKYKEE